MVSLYSVIHSPNYELRNTHLRNSGIISFLGHIISVVKECLGGARHKFYSIINFYRGVSSQSHFIRVSGKPLNDIRQYMLAVSYVYRLEEFRMTQSIKEFVVSNKDGLVRLCIIVIYLS